MIQETIFNDVLSKESLKIVTNRLKQEIGYRLAITIITDETEERYWKTKKIITWAKAIVETEKLMKGRG